MLKLLLLGLLGGCALFIQQIDTPLVSDTKKPKNVQVIPGHCPLDKKTKLQLVGTNDNSQQVYQEMVRALGPKIEDFYDHFALWNLLQFSTRPDQSSPTSRLQVMLHHKSKSSYYDFFSEETEDQYPYLYGIEWILKKVGKKRNLEYYAALLDQNLGQKLKIGKDFENFLVSNFKDIRDSSEMAPFYQRGTDVLKENETSPKLDYSRVIASYRRAQKKQKIIVNTSLTRFVTDKGQTGSCNYDYGLYENSIFLIDKTIPSSNVFGLALPTAAFMAASAQKLSSITSLEGLPLLKGVSKVRSSAVCLIETGEDKLWTFSNQSRDPGQHLFHLIRYGLTASKSTAEVDKLIKHSRHLFLSDPVRLVIESQKSGKAQIENLLKLNLPIYNAEKLGNVWAYTLFEKSNRFVIDDRNPGAFKCQ
ncbi:MAG TPA: hypothetical protein VNJ01_02380 [Bacteriovoracaceae bacterium]|nr:hypothetical protein [Bacteriovoracaceae bacterium]